MSVIRDGDWVRYRYTEPMAEARQITYRGQRDGDGGCSFTGKETVPAGDGVIASHEREVATNLESCTTKMERGTLASASSDSDTGATLTEGADAPLGDSAAPSASLASRTAWHRTYFEDPPGIDVNSARTNVSWTYDGSCVTSSWDHVTNYTWFTGWSKDSSSTTAARICSYARTTSYSTFKNTVFCNPLASTWTHYEPNRLRGQEDGGYDMYWEWRKSGDCSSLLSFHRTYGG